MFKNYKKKKNNKRVKMKNYTFSKSIRLNSKYNKTKTNYKLKNKSF